MISFTPALLNTLLGLVTALVVSVVAVGQYLAGRQKGWQDLAESRAETISDLQRDHATAIARGEAERDVLKQQITDASAVHVKDLETLNLRIDALEKMVAYVERQNHLLQVQLDVSEDRNATQHHTRKSKKATD